ncbi:MAG TPA: MoaD/ThiS family protein [Candidatus Polarisedimenticolia bacterium]|jgi:sulfur-carrier protein|nr:MoaD/ThiS family protein [Candidatus Polarisedimenticolia bacterium]
MAVQVRIPSVLRRQTNGDELVLLEGTTIAEVLAGLESRYEGLKGKLRGPQGEIRRFVNIYVNDNDVRLLDGSTTRVSDGDEVTIIPAVAGG